MNLSRKDRKGRKDNADEILAMLGVFCEVRKGISREGRKGREENVDERPW